MRLSVLLPAHNAEKTLRAAAESVLEQTHRDFELILIDDGSTDRTLEIMCRLAERDRRVRVMTHANIGMGASLNRAMAAVDTDWIARMDADDLMIPTRLERQVAFLQAHPDVVVVSCLVYYIDEHDRICARSSSDLLDAADFAHYMRSNRLFGISHPGAVMNRRAVLAVGGYRPQFWPSDDLDLWSRLAEAGHLILVQPEYLMKYRIHGASVCVSDPHRSQRQLRWVEACMRARRAGRPEPSLDEFLASERDAPWLSRLNRRRKDTALALYKSATYYYTAGRYPELLLAFCTSVLLEPRFGAGRFWSKVVLHKLRGGSASRLPPTFQRPLRGGRE